MSREVETIKRILSEDKGIKSNAMWQDYTDSMTEGIHSENIQRMFIDKSKEIMTELGVTKIFEELRDEGAVVWDNIPHFESKKTLFGLRSNIERVSSFTPAKIDFGVDRICVSIAFDHDYDGDDEYQKRVTVMQNDKGNYFVQSGGGKDFNERVNDKNNIPVLIAKAIITAKSH